MTEKACIKWIKDNLGPVIRQSLSTWDRVIYTEDWLGGLVYREVGILLLKYIPIGIDFEHMSALMKGDFGQRHEDKEPIYHGYSYFQIDIRSYPDFVKSEDWKDPLLSCNKAISVLESKRKYLQAKFKLLAGESLDRAITASYNCGEGNVSRSILANKDVDSTTTGHDYSKAVFGYRSIYRNV